MLVCVWVPIKHSLIKKIHLLFPIQKSDYFYRTRNTEHGTQNTEHGTRNNMITLKRTDSKDPDFISLVAQLDTLLAEMDGKDNVFYRQFNKIDQLRQIVVFYEDDQPVACGAIRAFDEEAMEVKRMYTVPAYRGKGLATRVLAELEAWASELGYSKCILETGKRQREAIALYEKNGYQRIPNYGPYIGVENSLCFEKSII